MGSDVSTLLALTRAFAGCTTLEQTLQAVVDHCVSLLNSPRVSLRLFDATRSRLLATCRAGQPMHSNATSEYSRGEGLIGWIAEQGAPLRTGDAEADARFIRRPDMVGRMGSFLGAPLVVDGQCIGVLAAVNEEKEWFSAHHEELIQLVAGISAPHVEVARLSRLAQVDALTGAFNRRGLEIAFPDGKPLSVVMIDLDHFKRINDELGHAAGDECLKRVAQLLSEVIRGEDTIVRYGGEEFVLVLPGTDLSHATRIAERARAAAEATVFRLGGVERRVTLSAGVALRKPDESREQTLGRADRALYAAKEQGRNRVVVAS